ncbi:MAG TPA: dihydrofolate reductase family protein [Thermoplasmata archaeon]|nr:dihydrofolate reductase family protein [Thermoplasmata archaeon]
MTDHRTPDRNGRRPFVFVNCAISLDGRLAYAGGRPARLSGPEDRRRVQELRASSDAILVGIGTVLADDPSLRVHWDELGLPPGRAPLRVVLDSTGRTPERARVLDGTQPTLVATAQECARRFPTGVEVFRTGAPRVDLVRLLEELGRRGVRSVMVEGGSHVIGSFLAEGLVERLTVFVAPQIVGAASAPPMVAWPENVRDSAPVQFVRKELRPIDGGLLATFEPTASG